MCGTGWQWQDLARFDAVVVDEAQDFADAWWPALLAALRDGERSGVYVCTDEGQRVFARFGGAPSSLVPLVLDTNLRNTRQIGGTFGSLAPMRMPTGTRFWDADQVFYGHVLGFKGLERRVVVLALNEAEPRGRP